MNKLFTIVLLASLASACSSYRTNTSISFDSTDMQGITPAIYVGEVTEKPEDLELLGWIDAEVTKPHVFAEDPTEEQAAIVLAKKGEELGANAVVYVSFKKQLTSGLLRKMVARGQAVKLKPEMLQAINSTEEVTTDNPLAENIGPITDNNAEIEKHAATAPTQIGKSADNMSSEDILKLPPKSWYKTGNAVSLQKQLEYSANHQTITTEPPACKPTINEIVDYEYKVQTYRFMLSNAEYLMKKSRGMNDEEMRLAAERLIRQITQQQEWLKTQKPAE